LARSGANDKRYLELHRGKWRVTVAVPKELQGSFGTTRLKQSLKIDSLTVANQLKWPVVAEMKAALAQAAGVGSATQSLAEELRQRLLRAQTDDQVEQLETAIDVHAEMLRGRRVGTDFDPHTGEEIEVFAPDMERRAGQFRKIATGLATPLDHLHSQYLAQLTVKARTKSDDTRAMALLKRWCEQEDVGPYLQSFPTKRSAVAFMDGLQALEPTLSPVTLNKYLLRLSRYWQWLEKREEVPSNIWQGLTLATPQRQHDELERPFTDEEIMTLLNGDASQAMHDVMRIAALTGCRIDPIVCLRVADCRDDGVFIFKPQKSEKGPRICPIHPDLVEIVARRTEGKQPDAPLFPEWPGPKDPKSTRERSFKTSNQFTAYRRLVGVADEREGRRRSLVNFHSFRRWFITKAEQADQPESIIAAVVGHKRQGMTLGVYSAGPKVEQARRCVEAVRLPVLAGGTSPDL